MCRVNGIFKSDLSIATEINPLFKYIILISVINVIVPIIIYLQCIDFYLCMKCNHSGICSQEITLGQHTSEFLSLMERTQNHRQFSHF